MSLLPNQYSALPLVATSKKLQKAQRYVAGAMSGCLGCWFLPVVSGVACSLIEAKLIHQLLRIMECHSEEAADKLYWFFRQKTFFLFGATYIPVAGVPLQLFETYGLGQFAIHCALRPELLTNDEWLEKSWKEVEADIFSGEHAIQSYEQFADSPFPDYARSTFIYTMNKVSEAYLFSQRIPGAAQTQKFLGSATKIAMRVGNVALEKAGKAATIGVKAASSSIARQLKKRKSTSNTSC